MDWRKLARDFIQGSTGARSPLPDAYSRITRTPIQFDDLPDGVGGYYEPDTDRMRVSRSNANPSTIPHESLHALYTKSGLPSNDPTLAGLVPRDTRAFITQNPGVYPNPEAVMADEGLAYSIGRPGSTEFVRRATERLRDPRVMRLHTNRLGVKALNR
jgi:hypothetical protein